MRSSGAERIIIGFSRTRAEELVELIRIHALHRVDISIVPRYYDVMTPDAAIDEINGVPIVDLKAAELSRGALRTKRVIDLTLTVISLPVLIPLFALIALLIKLDSRGPVFFTQERMGRDNRTFRIVKFRSMTVDAEAQRMAMADENELDGPLFKKRSDPRVTRIGGFLRRTSLDELPQLINVLRGQMSLVGPRPFVVHEDAEINGWARQRLTIPPGMTGLWQVKGRSDISFDEMLRLDHLYATRWSLVWDLRILAKTVPAVLQRRGAY